MPGTRTASKDSAATKTASPRTQDGQPGDVQDGQPGDVQDGQPGDGPADLAAAIRDGTPRSQLRAAGSALPAGRRRARPERQVTGRFWRAPTRTRCWHRPVRPGLDPWKDHLRERWAQGATNIRALHAEITALGYAGSYSTTYGYAGLLGWPPRPGRPPRPHPGRSPAGSPPTPPGWPQATRPASPPSCAAAPNWRPWPGTSPRSPRSSPAETAAAWTTGSPPRASPAQPELQSFANGIRRDYQAVRNGLTLEWSSGRVEGHNTRVKLLKRQMYGRASFPLLRKRILLTSRNARP